MWAKWSTTSIMLSGLRRQGRIRCQAKNKNTLSINPQFYTKIKSSEKQAITFSLTPGRNCRNQRSEETTLCLLLRGADCLRTGPRENEVQGGKARRFFGFVSYLPFLPIYGGTHGLYKKMQRSSLNFRACGNPSGGAHRSMEFQCPMQLVS